MPTSQWMRWNSTTHILELSTDFGATWAPLSLDAAVLTAGVLAAARIPNLDASILTSGLLALARGGTGVDLSAAGGATKVLAQDAAHVITARNLIAADIPNLSAAVITSGLVALARGGTNADLSATGGASQFLKQAAAGSAISVAQPSSADISDYVATTWTPVLIDSGTGGTPAGTTYTTHSGSYIRIGNFYFLLFNILLSAKGTFTDAITIGGFPNFVSTSRPNPTNAINFGSMATTWAFLGVRGRPGFFDAHLYGNKVAAVAQSLVFNADITATSQFLGSICMWGGN